MSKVRISHVLRFISICDLFIDSPSHYIHVSMILQNVIIWLYWCGRIKFWTPVTWVNNVTGLGLGDSDSVPSGVKISPPLFPHQQSRHTAELTHSLMKKLNWYRWVRLVFIRGPVRISPETLSILTEDPSHKCRNCILYWATTTSSHVTSYSFSVQSYRKDWFSGNSLNLCSRGARFVSRLRQRLPSLLCVFALLGPFRPIPLPSKSSPIHHASIMIPVDTL
jgi:hypothetical protein